MSDPSAPRTWMIVLAFAALYLIWGSTYLGIKIAIETMPPFLMTTSRFVLAGAVLYVLARFSGVGRPSLENWKQAFVVGALLIAGGNGVVALAEKWIDSSMAALIIASNPMFMTVIGWWGGVQNKPMWRDWLSLAVGFAGVTLLVAASSDIVYTNSVYGYVAILVAVLLWTAGTIYSKRNPQTINPWMQSGMQMISGGVVCLVAGLASGELAELNIAAVSVRSWFAFGYLFLVGSLVGFTAYVYLLRHCQPTAVSSHAYVNPVVAVFLGWLILGETHTLGSIIGACLVLLAVYELLRKR